jgi:UDP-N-acetylmuramyl tripeptide synthase
VRLSDLLAALALYEGRGLDLAGDITGVTDDSRCVQPGYLFVAVRGATVDGHRFIPQALAAGAGAIVGEAEFGAHAVGDAPYIKVPEAREALGWLQAAWHGYPSDGLVLTGVTGTDGKTTTTNLVYAILSGHGYDTGMVSTVNARIGAESYDTGLHTTTPSAGEIQALLSRMVAHGSTHAARDDVPWPRSAAGRRVRVRCRGLHQYHARAPRRTRLLRGLFPGQGPPALGADTAASQDESG